MTSLTGMMSTNQTIPNIHLNDINDVLGWNKYVFIAIAAIDTVLIAVGKQIINIFMLPLTANRARKVQG